jgi:hypothetical protein
MIKPFHADMKRISGALTVSVGVLLLATAPPRAQSNQVETRQGSITPTPATAGRLLAEPPVDLPQGERLIHPRIDPPVDPSVRPETIQPTSLETEAKIVPQALQEAPDRDPAAPLAPGTFASFRNTTLASAPVVGGVTLNRYTPIEPSGAANGRVIFYTTNSYAAVSGDRGQTFSYLNPFTFFTSANGGFGGDQVVYYARRQGLMFWLLQYNPDNTTNTQRLAVARSQEDILNGNWIVYDWTPADFGFTTPPAGATGFWLDFPDLSVSDNFLYQTTNVFPRILPNPTNQCAGSCPGGAVNPCPAACGGNCPNPCASRGAVVSRVPLDQLAAGGTVNYRFFSDTNSGYRCTQGAQGTMYWGAHNSTSQIRIYRWDETSTSVASDNVNHTAYSACPGTNCMNAMSPDGTNFAASSDSRILGAWVANNVIGFMWNAAQGGGFTFPHVQVLRFNEPNRSLLSQGQIFNNNHAWLYPSVHPNDRGHLGGTIAWGGGTFFPNAAAWIADDFNSGTITPLENLTFAAGGAGPANNRWGDYFATRITPPYGNTWSGTGYVLSGAGGATRQPNYVWFGRERDAPPSTNTIFVAWGNTSGFEDGSFVHPYRTVTRGHFAAVPQDTILISAGNYLENVTFTTPVRVDTIVGTVGIGK